jgi:hypothetical protein
MNFLILGKVKFCLGSFVLEECCGQIQSFCSLLNCTFKVLFLPELMPWKPKEWTFILSLKVTHSIITAYISHSLPSSLCLSLLPSLSFPFLLSFLPSFLSSSFLPSFLISIAYYWLLTKLVKV